MKIKEGKLKKIGTDAEKIKYHLQCEQWTVGIISPMKKEN
jgi:hypothetical protein